MSSITISSNRRAFFDNLRSLMVLLVLVFHSGASYGTAVKFWPFHDQNPSKGIDLFMFLGDVFMMAVLFFTAGYFALPNIQKKGTWKFVTGKLKRLGIPWLIITVIILPVIDYINYFAQKVNHDLIRPFGEYWLLSMKKIAEFHTGWMDMSAYWNMTENFYQRYMWFVSLLLVFFIIFALLYKIKAILDEKTRWKKNNTPVARQVAIRSFLTAVVITVLLFGFIRFLIYPEFLSMGWFSILNIIQFQFGKLAIYLCCFALGIYAFSNKWFSEGTSYGKAWIWALICICLFGVNMIILKNIVSTDNPSLILKLCFTVFYPLWSFSFLGFFVSLTFRHWNRPTRFNMSLAKNSYNMYLIHYIFPFTLPLLLRYWKVPTVIKFALLSAVTVIFSYLLSKYVLKPVRNVSINFLHQ